MPPAKRTITSKTTTRKEPTVAVRKPRSTTTVPAHPLSHRIPDPSVEANYVRREVHGVTDLALLQYCHTTRKNVLFSGPTGLGKTTMIRAYCSLKQIPLVVVNANGEVDPQVLFGGLVQVESDGRTKVQWVDSEITQVIRFGGVLLLDEVNFMKPRISACLHSLTDDRRMVTIMERGNEVVDAHPDLFVVAAYNDGYNGTYMLNEAFKNRFHVKARLDYVRDVEERLVMMPTLLEVAQAIRARAAEGDVMTPVSTNMLTAFEELSVDLGLDFAISNFMAAFSEDEVNAVATVFDVNRTNLESELAEMLSVLDAEEV